MLAILGEQEHCPKMSERLPQINRHLARQIKKILEKNKAERHLRGGEATRRKYLSLREKVQ